MKKVLSTAVGVLLAAGVTLGGAATAFADNSHAPATHGQSANHEQSTNHGQSGSTTHGQSSGTHGNSGETHGQAGSQGKSNKTQHQAEVQALKAAIANLHQALKADQSERRLLVQTKQQFEKSLQGAIAAGDTAEVQADIVKAKTALQAIHQAVIAQNEANKSLAAGHKDQSHGDLTNAINAINNATARVEAKTTAMQGAIIVLEGLVSSLNGNAVGNNTTSTMGNNTTSTTGNNTTSTTGNNTTGG